MRFLRAMQVSLLMITLLVQHIAVATNQLQLDVDDQFNISLPSDWIVQKTRDPWSDSKRRVAVGPQIPIPESDKLIRSEYDEQRPDVDPYRPHLSVRTIQWGPLFPRKDYVDHYLQLAVYARMIKRHKFATNNQWQGDVVVFEWEGQRARLRQTTFLFPVSEKLFLIECDILARNGDQLDATFEAIAKTFGLKSTH